MAAAAPVAPARPDAAAVAAASGPPWLRRLLLVAAAIYLASTVLHSTCQRVPRSVLPAPLLYFVQTACLFPRAKSVSIDYRLEAWRCATQQFREVDTRVLFPMHADDKENRFQRLAHFHRQNRPVLQALERHVITRLPGATGREAIGGIRLSSVRTPLPLPGEALPVWSRPPLAELPEDWIKHWYYTPRSRRGTWCGEGEP